MAQRAPKPEPASRAEQGRMRRADIDKPEDVPHVPDSPVGAP